MRYTIKLHGITVGWSELESFDAVEQRASGVFRPGLGYELVQPIFSLFTQAVPMKGGEPLDQEKLERYHAARDKLGLELFDAAGVKMDVSTVHIAEYGGVIEMEVLVGRGWVEE